MESEEYRQARAEFINCLCMGIIGRAFCTGLQGMVADYETRKTKSDSTGKRS